jgi:hypothetical protein
MGKVIKIAVLGLGKSLSLFKKENFDLSIGVNDIWRYVKTDIVVCLDHEKVFKPERLKAIKESAPQAFYSQIVNWDYRKDFIKLNFYSQYPEIGCNIDKPTYEKSFCSPFVAAQIAYKEYGADEIHVFGVDLLNHPHLDARLCGRIKKHFINLKTALIKVDCKLIIHGEGILKDI